MKLIQTPKRQKQETDFSKCVFSCKNDQDPRCLGENGTETFLASLKVQQDTAAYKNLAPFLYYEGDKLKLVSSAPKIMIHNSCYASFTSKEHLARIKTDFPQQANDRAVREKFDFLEKCFICRQKSKNGDKFLIRVATIPFCDNIQTVVDEKIQNNDKDAEAISRFVAGDFRKLIPFDAGYHKNCHPKFIRKSKESSQKAMSIHDQAFNEIMNEVIPLLEQGKVFNMNELLERYQAVLKRIASEKEAMAYTRQCLKQKLQKNVETM